MKIPTYRKYGLTKSQVEKQEENSRRFTYLLTHSLPFLLGAAAGTGLYFVIHRNSLPQTFTELISRVFIFASSGVLSIAVLMLLFKVVELIFSQFREQNPDFQNIQHYKSDRDEYEYKRIRSDESFWRLIDGMSVENELLKVFKSYGFLISPVYEKQNEEKHDYILTNNIKNIYFRCNTSIKSDNGDNITELLSMIKESPAKEAILFSRKPFEKKHVQLVKGKPVKLMMIKDAAELVKNMK